MAFSASSLKLLESTLMEDFGLDGLTNPWESRRVFAEPGDSLALRLILLRER